MSKNPPTAFVVFPLGTNTQPGQMVSRLSKKSKCRERTPPTVRPVGWNSCTRHQRPKQGKGEREKKQEKGRDGKPEAEKASYSHIFHQDIPT